MTDSPPAQAEHQITITRVFDAPRELVFKAWTDPDQLASWFGPAGLETPRESVEIDLRVGGRFHLRMVKPGSDMEHRLRYEIIELVEPELLVLKSAPMPEVGVPHSTITRVELAEEGDKTRMTLTDGPYAEEGGGGAEAGWRSSFDKLEGRLGGSG
ncbi:MAG: SRPBCC domain-containing protein [Actinomycetota bacterium]|nr:SRPBCC domain-containing protein [Actinomycetota bacterium]